MPDWGDRNYNKFVIKLYENIWVVRSENVVNNIFSFQSEEIRDKFFENFKELLEQVKPLFI